MTIELSCWAAIKILMAKAGAEAVYDVFGVRFIQADPNGWGVAGAVNETPIGGWFFRKFGKSPDETLEEVIENPGNKVIIGVIGLSWGANVVARVFSKHAGERQYDQIPFFLDASPNELDYVKDLPNYAGHFGFWHCGWGCGIEWLGIPIGHGPKNTRADAERVFYCFKVVFNDKIPNCP